MHQTIRNPAHHPICGDVWRLPHGAYFIVDFTSPFKIGITFSDHNECGFDYREAYQKWLQNNEAELISLASDALNFNTTEESLEFLKEIINVQ